MPRQSSYHCLEYEEVLLRLRSRLEGLDMHEAASRLKAYGLNRLAAKKRPSLIIMYFAQFKDLMTVILLAATLVSGLLGEYADAITIIAIVLLNSGLGLFHELRAEKALLALRKLEVPMATVRRQGQEQAIPGENLVPGDIVVLKAGDRVPADIRLGQAYSCEIDEASLTGESVPVRKVARAMLAEAPLSERHSSAHFGTLVTKGYAIGVVTATGMSTEVGRVAAHLEVEEKPTPLQIKFRQLGTYLVVACLAVCALVVVLGVMRDEPLHRMFLAGVSLAVAAIPEGLSTLVTIVLALGVHRIAKVNAVVRRLPAVETMGSTTVICSDKTGTLTLNKMTVREVLAGGTLYNLASLEQQLAVRLDSPLWLALKIGSLCSTSKLIPGDPPTVVGDPTEGAILMAAARAKVIPKESVRSTLPFCAERKAMSVIVSDLGAKNWVYTKGAPESILRMCSYVVEGEKRLRIESSHKEALERRQAEFAARGLRVLAVAYREYSGPLQNENVRELESNLTFVGLIAMHDPPRPEVLPAIKLCRLAGIRVIMITGDHALTALAIAEEIGLPHARGEVVAGAQIDAMTDAELWEAVKHANVFARVSPLCKLRIVKTLQRQGHIVAMTGDGINDAPALREADIGISMGLCGTEVAREASQLVLQDDNFATIVKAMQEGRGIYDNIRKFLRYLLTCNVGELVSVVFTMAIGLPIPLQPMQILWINLVTDGLPALALGVDTTDKNIMLRPPRPKDEGVFGRGLWRKIVARGLLIGLSTFFVFAIGLFATNSLEASQTMAFATLVMCQLLHVFDCRSETVGIAEKGITTNPFLLVSVGLSVALLMLSIYFPPLSKALGNVPLWRGEWAIVLLAAGCPTVFIGLRRLLLYRTGRKRP